MSRRMFCGSRARSIWAWVWVVLAAGPTAGGCDDPPPPPDDPITPPPSDFDPIVATTAVGTIPGDASVTPDGAFTYSMPIVVPPGRAGMQPTLAVNYGSSEVESALGVGFALSGLSAITRCPRTLAEDGEVRAVELRPDDRLCLDGQRLVLEDGTYGAPGSRYRTEADELLLVEAIGIESELPDEVAFRVRMPDGHERQYGASEEGGVRALNRNRELVRETWLLSRELDPRGNTVDYSYAHETFTRAEFDLEPCVPGPGHRCPPDRVRGTREVARIARIDYTGRVDGEVAERGTRSVRFGYADIRYPLVGSCDTFPADEGVSTSALCARPAPRWAFSRGSATYRPSRRPLETIETYIGDERVAQYRFRGSDHPASHLYRLDEIQHCVTAPAASETDADADDGRLVCMPPTVFEWRDRALVARPNFPEDLQRDPRHGLATFQRWDISLDRAALRNSFRCGTDDRTGLPLWCEFANPIAALDVNGDGADDIVYRRDNRTGREGDFVFRLGRAVPRDTRSWPAAGPIPYGTTVVPLVRSEVPFLTDVDRIRQIALATRNVFVLDWNVDGRDDLVMPVSVGTGELQEQHLLVLESESVGGLVSFVLRTTGFAEPVEVADINGFAHVRSGVARWTAADMNGDGRQDVVACVVDEGCEPEEFGWLPGEPAYAGCRGHWAISVRGDAGFSRLQHSSVVTECRYEFGEAPVQNLPVEPPPGASPYVQHVETGDFNGDGRQELIIAEPYFWPQGADPEDIFRRVLRYDEARGLYAEDDENLPRTGPVTAVDVNGDGMHDVVYSLLTADSFGMPPDIERPETFLYLATGDGFVTEIPAGFEVFMPDRRRVRLRLQPGDVPPNYTRQVLPLIPFDMNRDGRGDLLAPTLDADETVVRRVPGSSDLMPRWTWGEEGVWVAEVLSGYDVYAYPTNGAFGPTEYLESCGSALCNPTLVEHEPLVLDADGDGALDVLNVPRNFPLLTSFVPQTRLFHNVRAEAPLIERIRDGMGVRTEVVYRNLSDPAVYTAGSGCSYPERCITDSREVVYELRRDDGVSGFRTERFRYQDGRANLTGRGWLGFSRVESRDMLSGSITVTFFDNTRESAIEDGARIVYPLAHRPVSTFSYTHDPTIAGSVRLQGSQGFFAYAVTAPGPGRYRVRTSNVIEEAYEGTLATINPNAPFLGASLIRRSIRDVPLFDEHGFALTTTVTTLAGGNSRIETEWEHDPSIWRLGFVRRRSTTLATGTLAACDREVVEEYVNDLPLGRVRSATRSPGVPDAEQTATLFYDRFGNITQIAAAGRGEDGGLENRIDTVFWDPEGYFPVEAINALGHVSTMAFEPRYGTLRASVDPNWIEDRNYIDGFGRPRIAESDLGQRSETTYLREMLGRFSIETTSNVGGRMVFETDRLGRALRVEATHAFRTVERVATYDARGRVASIGEPRDVGSTTDRATRYTYDGLDRLRRVVDADNVRMDYRYEVNRVHRTNALGHTWTTVHDGLGQVLFALEPSETGTAAGGRTDYLRCASGEVLEVRDALDHTIRVAYDALGRRVSLDDPDAGFQRFEYDGWDELVRTEDAAERVTRFVRDALGRLVERHDEADGTVARWTYDSAPLGERLALGLLERAVSGDGVVDQFEYDALARPVSVTRTLSDFDGTLVSGQSYDERSRLSAIDYPSVTGTGVHVEYEYDDVSGELTRVADGPGELSLPYWELFGQDVHGMPARETVGVALRESTYTRAGRLESLVTRAGPIDLQRFRYQYESRGMLRGRDDRLARRNEVFAHDALGRLFAVRERGRTIESYDYDQTGNLLATHDATLSYPALPSEPRPHGVTDYDAATGEVWTAEYDAVGNVTDLGPLSITWNQRNLPRSMVSSGTAASLQYDADGSRAMKVAGSELTVYFGAYEVRQVGLGLEERTVIATPAGPVAQVEVRSDGEVRSEQTRWLFTERQGSVETSWLEDDDPVHHRYDAFGGVLDAAGNVTGGEPSAAVSHGYTGHEHDGELGLVNMNGRIYHPRLRRFLSADPVSSGVNQGLNRYSYVLNSPMQLTDPTGYDWWDVSGGRPVSDEEHDRYVEGCIGASECGFVASNYLPGGEFDAPSGTRASDGASDRAGAALTGEAVAPSALERIGSQLLDNPMNLLAGLAGFGAGATIGYGTTVLIGAGLSNPVTAPFVVVGAIGFGVYTLMHADEVAETFIRPFETIAKGEATPATYFDAMASVGMLAGGGAGASSVGPGTATGMTEMLGSLASTLEGGLSTAVLESAVAPVITSGASTAAVGTAGVLADTAVMMATSGGGGSGASSGGGSGSAPGAAELRARAGFTE